MERVGTLINKLKEQYDQQAGADKIAVTAQLLLAELQKNAGSAPRMGKISVVMPSFRNAAASESVVEGVGQRTTGGAPVINIGNPPTNDAGAVGQATNSGSTPTSIGNEGDSVVVGQATDIGNAAANSDDHTAPITKPVNHSGKDAPIHNWLFDAQPEIPTLAHQAKEAATAKSAPQPGQAGRAEFNTVLANRSESLNDKLKEDKTEVATVLQGTPVRDLKKAIGINDRFLFVNELFRGDENMYERSVKTINSFTIYAEAEYWIQRELKVKLSWTDGSETVRLFDQLIKRRFS